MSELWSDLLTCLDLTADPANSDDPAAPVVYEGRNQDLPYHRVFGGQILGQLVRAAELTCPSKTIKSLHVLFAREGKTSEPMRYEVSRQHEGRSFATLSAVARQGDSVSASATIAMHAAEDGPDLQSVAPVGAVLGEEHRISGMDLIPWDTRSTVDLNSSEVGEPEFELWMRTPEVKPDLASALVSYATDLTLIGTALRPVEGFNQTGNGTVFLSAVTSHNIWFHRPFRTDEWLLLRQHSPLVAHGRCFGRGDILTEEGTLVASFAQEALLRLPQPEKA
ncbi:acyl-CoA thioesterase [Aldersonia kunmingensis]|uniref:acyl-CoA thioesterase n=1 Tax=Aldersonia kunmingensis TaxID=408066 RepID=UPI00082F5916|nr:acyl-CoA thioesterase domain-containing protein [Aldersonia kunmingensis]